MLKFISRSNHRRRPRSFSSLYLSNDVLVLYTSLTSNNLASFFLTDESLPYRIHCLPPLVTVRFFLGSFATSCLPKFLEDVGKSSDRITSSDDDTAWYDREDIGDIDEASNISEHSDTENGAQVHVDLLPRRKYTGVPVGNPTPNSAYQRDAALLNIPCDAQNVTHGGDSRGISQY